MINSFYVKTQLGDELTVELGRPEISGFLVRFIDGLDPTKADIEMTQMAMMNGAVFNSSRSGSRNIVISLEYKGDVETMRRASYQFFPLRERVTLRFFSNTRSAEVFGYIESNKQQIFSKGCGCLISVQCPSSFLHALENQRTDFSAVESLFEFPFSNESLTENLIEFSELQINPEKTIFYEGEADRGVVLYIHALGIIEMLAIHNVETNESMVIDTDRLELLTGGPFDTGDDIIISTVEGQKYAKLVRDGVETNIMNCLERDPDWFELHKGNNPFTYTADVGESNVQLTIEADIVYEGI